jgi:hypothetical protein
MMFVTQRFPQNLTFGMVGQRSGVGEARAGDKVGLALDDGVDELGDVARVELPVTVDVDDDVRATAHRALEAGAEHFPQPRPVVHVHDDCPDLGGALGGAIGRAVVHNDHLDLAHAGDLAGHAGDDLRDRVFFVQSRDRDDKLHRRVRYSATGVSSALPAGPAVGPAGTIAA